MQFCLFFNLFDYQGCAEQIIPDDGTSKAKKPIFALLIKINSLLLSILMAQPCAIRNRE
jgi:hypothetical protein